MFADRLEPDGVSEPAVVVDLLHLALADRLHGQVDGDAGRAAVTELRRALFTSMLADVASGTSRLVVRRVPAYGCEEELPLPQAVARQWVRPSRANAADRQLVLLPGKSEVDVVYEFDGPAEIIDRVLVLADFLPHPVRAAAAERLAAHELTSVVPPKTA